MISAVERGRHLPGLEVLLTLSQVLHVSPGEVLERLELARSESIDSRELSLDDLNEQASQSFWSGDPRRAVRFYDEVLRRLATDCSEDARRQIAVTEIRRGGALRRVGATAAARAAIERAITLSDHDRETQAEAYLLLVAVLVQIGCLPLARDAADRGVALADGCRPQIQAYAWIEKGEVLAASGLYAEARDAFLNAKKWVLEIGDRRHEIKVEGNVGHCLRCMGQYKQARQRFVSAVELARKNDDAASEALWLVELARLSRVENRLDDAEGFAAAALRVAKPREQILTCFRAEWLRHELVRSSRPDDLDRHRVAYLKKLYVRLEEHRGIEEVQEFKSTYCSAGEGDPK